MTIKYYQKEHEAKIVLIKLDKEPKEFCPLANAKCRIDCMCYVEAHIVKIHHSGVYKYHVVAGYCGNEMFTYAG